MSVTPSELVRSSAGLIALNSQHVVEIDAEAIQRVAAQLFTSEKIADVKKKYAERTASPMLFDSLDAEVNFACVSAMLAFGSGYRPELHRLCGRGAAETMLYGMIGLHMTHGNLTADVLLQLTPEEVAEAFQLPINEEYELSPAVRAYRASPLKPLLDAVRGALHGAGARLRALQYADFAAYFMKAAHTTAAYDDDGNTFYSCQSVLASLINDFPIFADDAEIVLVPPPSSAEAAEAGAAAGATADAPADAATATEAKAAAATPEDEAASGEAAAEAAADAGAVTYRVRAHVYKKAQLLLADLQTRFSARVPAFNWSDGHTLTIFADNVVPAMLTSLGVLRPCRRLARRIAAREPLARGAAYALRCAALAATELLLDCVNAAHTASDAGAVAAAGTNATPAPELLPLRPALAALVSAPDSVAVDAVAADGTATPATLTPDGFPALPPAAAGAAAPLRSRRTVLSAPELDFCLYLMGKETPELRSVERHSLRDTTAY